MILQNQTIFFILGGIMLVGFGITSFFLFQIYRKWDGVFGSAKNNKDVLSKLLKKQEVTEKELSDAVSRIQALEKIGKLSVQKIGFLRFNPFSHTGGENSFALTLLDSQNNGVIISSLYTRDGVRVYGKAIEKGVPRQPLSREEQATLDQAIQE